MIPMNAKNPLRKFEASAADNVLTFLVYSDIGADYFGDGITASSFADALEANPNCTSILLRINSPGGDPFEATAILNLLQSAGKPITVIIDGVACSAASILAMCGNEVLMGQGSMIMIHNASTIFYGNSDEFIKMADTLAKVSSSMADIYVKKTGLSKEEVQTMMDAETWLSVDEAIAKGFATGTTNAASPEVKAITSSFDFKMYKNAPKFDSKTDGKDNVQVEVNLTAKTESLNVPAETPAPTPSPIPIPMSSTEKAKLELAIL